jgi:hypothetical protein
MIPVTIGQAQLSIGPLVATNARFRVVVAAPLPTAVDVWLDGALTTQSGLNAVQPLNDSGSITVSAGSHTIRLTQTGTTTQVGTDFVGTFNATTNTSVILDSNMNWMILDNAGTAPLPTHANARVVNLSSHNNPVSVALDGSVPGLFSNIVYKTASTSYLSIPVGIHALTVPGTTAKTVNYNFQDARVYSIFIFWDPALSSPKILASAETTFATATPGPGSPGPIRMFLPIVDH